jgi:hypothetical protein
MKFTSCAVDPTAIYSHDASTNHDHLNKVFDPIFSDFDRVLKRHAAFNLFFVSLCTIEVVILAVFFVTLAQSLVLALSLSVVFFTFFAYFTLRIYFQTKKPEQFEEIKDRYLAACKDLLGYQEGHEEHYNALANACCKFANRLHAREYNYYSPPSCVFHEGKDVRRGCW